MAHDVAAHEKFYDHLIPTILSWIREQLARM